MENIKSSEKFSRRKTTRRTKAANLSRMKHPNKIRLWRNHAGISQDALAELSGVVKSHISNLETGKKPYNHRVLEKLADALNTTPEALVNIDPTSIVTAPDTENLLKLSLQTVGVRRSVPLRNPLHTGAWIKRAPGGALGDFIVFVRPEHATLDLAVRRLDDKSVSKLYPAATHVLTAPLRDIGAGDGSLVVFEIIHETDDGQSVESIVRVVRDNDGQVEYWTGDDTPERFIPPAGRARIDGVAIQVMAELPRPARLLEIDVG